MAVVNSRISFSSNELAPRGNVQRKLTAEQFSRWLEQIDYISGWRLLISGRPPWPTCMYQTRQLRAVMARIILPIHFCAGAWLTVSCTT